MCSSAAMNVLSKTGAVTRQQQETRHHRFEALSDSLSGLTNLIKNVTGCFLLQKLFTGFYAVTLQ